MLSVERMFSTRCLQTQASPFSLWRRTPTTSGLCRRHTSSSKAMVTFPKSPLVRHLRVYLKRGKVNDDTLIKDCRQEIQEAGQHLYLPFLCEINVFLRQDGEDLVQDLVRVGLTGQSHVVLDLTETYARRGVVQERTDPKAGGALLRSTLILRGPSRRFRFLLGVSMLIILSRPLSREPNTFPVLFFLPLSLVAAISRDRDLRSKSNQTFKSVGKAGLCRYVFGSAADVSPSRPSAAHPPPFRTEGQDFNVGSLPALLCPRLAALL